MKNKLIIVAWIMVYLLPVKSQNQQDVTENYWNYHDLICKAEIAFYLNNNIDSCLYYYNQAFNTFTFNYVHDLVNAAQIAYFSEKEYEHFIHKGMHYGLKSSHLKQIPLLKEVITEVESFEKTPEYHTIRENYLSKLDLDYLSWIYDLGIEDQIKKMESNYDIYSLSYINDLISEIKQNGFPSNKIIGIDDATIFSEIGDSELDLSQRVKNHHDIFWRKEMRPEEVYKISPNTKQYSDGEEPVQISLGNDIDMVVSIFDPIPAKYYYKIDEQILSNHFIMVLLHHRGCSYSELKDIMLEEIAKGNFHPREFGLVYDRQYEASLEILGAMHANCPQLVIEDGIFKIGYILSHYEVEEYPQEKVNALRAKYHIVPLEVDNMKRVYESYGFKLFWGFWECL